jgi:predicted nucleic acid-binding Zn ribbon protein
MEQIPQKILDKAKKDNRKMRILAIIILIPLVLVLIFAISLRLNNTHF